MVASRLMGVHLDDCGSTIRPRQPVAVILANGTITASHSRFEERR